jgi:autotransporter-associated beta strand protein
MKKLGLLALLVAAPLSLMAQFAVFTDDFNHGSTLNLTSNPGGTPFTSFTSYDVASTKNTTTSTTLTNGELKLQLTASTSSGLDEIEAVFTKNPITLVNIGDSITLSYMFRMTNGLPGNTAYLAQGLYNSGGTVPVPGGALNNAGLGVSGNFTTGNAQQWQGIYSRFFGSGGTSATFFRPQQSGATTSAAQDLIGPGVTGGFANPGPTTLSGNLASTTAPLVNGAYYTVTMTIYLADTNIVAAAQTLNITNTLSDSSSNVLATFSSTATGNSYMTTFDSLALGRRDTSSVLITMVATNISITANLSTFPGQPFNVTGGGQGCPGDTFPVGLNGSVGNNAYYLYTNGVWNGAVLTGTGAALSFPAETVISVPLTNTVFASNTVSGATGFMLGSAVVNPNPPTVIAAQPFPLIVANSSIGIFHVDATGGGLKYQWFKNGALLSDNGHITGSTTPTLVITSVGAGDAASTAQGYYAVITNGCGAITPTLTNSLTIGAPANITWQATMDTNWDFITTNFIDASQAPVLFHNGDNVTLDDSSFAQNINIANNFIAPSLITDNSGATYSFGGPGVIQGPGSLVMNGSGTLSLNNSNAFTGGITVSNGTVVLNNSAAAGPSTITLAGGILDFPNAFASAVGVSNNVNAATNGTVTFDKTGTFALVLDGLITGNSGATLTINGSAGGTATSRLRLYGSFTNNANIFLESGGAEMEFAPYLPSGDEVYNGVISGTAGHIVPRGAGNVVLNNTNTFNDSTGSYNGIRGYSVYMSSGNVGIGADSVSTTPPTIDASPAGTGWLGIGVGAESGTDTIYAYGAAHTIGNLMGYNSASNTVTLILGGTNNLTFSGEFDLANAANGPTSGLPTDDAGGTNRTLQVTNTAATTFSGLITDNGNSSGITKTGSGALYLNGADNYTGLTTVNAGRLAGSGSIVSAVDVQTNGAIGGGPASNIGTFTINNTLTFDSGGAFIRINKAASPGQSNDVVSVSGAIAANAGAGTITVSNIGVTAVNVGDKFKIFNKAVTGVGTFSIVGAGMNWNNNLAVDGSIIAASVNTGPATNPTNLTFSVSGTNLNISWPTDHQGWYLQMNTNSLNSNSWTDVTGSNAGTNSVIPIDPAKPRVFIRMSLNP